MSASVPSLLIADVLATSLPSVVADLCTQRYGGPLSLRRREGPDSSSSTISFEVLGTDLPSFNVHFAIRPLGGNMYDVQGQIEDGPCRSFIYSLPTPLLVPEAPHLTREIASFLLESLERHLGIALLRNEIRFQPPLRHPRPPRPTRRQPSRGK